MKFRFVRVFISLLVVGVTLQFPTQPALGNTKAVQNPPSAAIQETIPEDPLYSPSPEQPSLILLEEVLPGEREYIPPSLEVIAKTQEKVNAFDCATVTDVLQIECEALVSLYNSTNGAGWRDNTNWLTSTTVENWIGVTVSDTHILEIDLGNNALSGSIPTELGDLTILENLALGSNQLSGSIPDEIGNLTNLLYLTLSNNQLSGSIPDEIGNLTKLSKLIISSTYLSGAIPTQLGGLTNLQILNLSDNQLSGSIPDEIGNLTKLRYLSLSNNQLSGSIPDEIGNLVSLQSLYLNSNQLSGSIPATLGNLTSLRCLYLDWNDLTGSIPDEMGNLTSVLGMDLSDNELTGDVPASFTNLVNLCSPDNYASPCLGVYLLDLGFNRLNVPATEPPASFLAIKDPDWYLTQAVIEQIEGETGGTILSNDGTTEILIPSGLFTGTVTFFFFPLHYPEQPIGNRIFLGKYFELSAMIGDIPVTSFNQPLTLTLHYDQDLPDLIQESALTLYYWDNDMLEWVDAVTTCPGGEYTRNLDENWFSLPLCHLSEFALMVEPFMTYLPTIFQ